MGRASSLARNLRASVLSDDADVEGFESSPPSIRMENLSFSYGGDVRVLDSIDLDIDSPGLYCIVGPNGVGKSTLVKCICKIHDATEGEVYLNGRSVSSMTHRDVSRVLGYVPVMMSDVFSMTVLETIMVGCQNRGLSASQRFEAVYNTMDLLNIGDLAGSMFNELSAGQHQKVSIARGIVQRPRILILDEPTANLDVKYQVYVTELLRALAESEGMIVLMISHDLNISAKYAHCIIMMSAPGTVYKVGPPEEVITKESVETIYRVHCRVIVDEESGAPIVVLGQPMMDEDGNIERGR